jgi:hypothetical protein
MCDGDYADMLSLVTVDDLEGVSFHSARTVPRANTLKSQRVVENLFVRCLDGQDEALRSSRTAHGIPVDRLFELRSRAGMEVKRHDQTRPVA